MSDLSQRDVLDLLDVKTFFALREIPIPSDDDGVIDRLVQEKFVDRIDGLSIRRRAALLLANRLSDFPELNRKAPRVVCIAVHPRPIRLSTGMKTKVMRWAFKRWSLI